MNKKIKILELNNIDAYGKRFNGFSLQKYINNHSDIFSAKMLVNYKLCNDKNTFNLFRSDALLNQDWEIEQLEKTLKIKNQLSVSEYALISHRLYKTADILHFHMYHNMHLPIEFLTRIPKEKKIVLDIHDTFWLTDKNIPMLEAFNFCNPNKKTLDAERKRVLNSIDADFVVHSKYMLNLFKKSDATKNLRVHLIPFGIDSNTFSPKSTRKAFCKKHKISYNSFIIFCRSQKEFKGIQYINNALKKLRINKPITVITVGVKGLLDNTKNNYRLIELGIIENENKMSEIFNACDCFLSPSTEESFGFMAIEAMACEKPVIVFDGTALPETVNAPNIGISTKRTATDLAKAINHLASNPQEIESRGKAGRKYILKHYTETKYYTGYINLFKKLKNRNPKPYINDKKPNDIDSLIPFLNGEKILSAFDFNNTSIQKEIKNYNEQMYDKILKQGKTPKSILKKLVPMSIKKKINIIIGSNHEKNR